MKIIIYGLGKGLEYIEQNLKKEHEIIGYSDSYATISIFKGKPFYTPEKLATIDFDFLIIAVRNRKEAWKLFELLTGDKYGLPETKVIPFYVYANGEYWDFCMAHADVENVEGLVFGTSYARYGILQQCLSRKFVNLSVPSQDLYSDWETFKMCIKKYGDRLKKMKYIMIDMYDYNYFNFDASLCKMFFKYLGYGGIIKKHNYGKNHNYSQVFEKELLYQIGVIKETECGKSDILEELFYERYALDYVETQKNRWGCIEPFEPLPVRHFTASIVEKKYRETIEENKRIFDHLLEDIREFNPNIKIILLLLPRYSTLETTKEKHMERWKAEFEEIVSNACQRENVYWKNYKFCECVSGNRKFWNDIEHMNTIGGKCMTSIIDEDLKREIY